MGNHRRPYEARLQGNNRGKASQPLVVIFSLTLAILSLLATRRTLPAASADTPMELWYWHHSYLVNDDAVDKSRKLVDKAAAAGYNGLALWDSGLNSMGKESWPLDNEAFMRDLLKYAAGKHMKIMVAPTLYGFSNEQLEVNPNWAEAQRVVGSHYKVNRDATKLDFQDSFPGVANGDFESGKEAWFSTGDNGIGVNAVAHSGKSAGVVVDAPANARFRQKIPLTPWRQYHLRMFYKSSNFRGGPMISVLDSSNLEKVRFNVDIHANGTHDWTQLDYIFNSQDSTEAFLYFGVWGGSSGILWFDDVSVQETALVYLVRRAGAPVRVYDPEHPGPDFVEGRDFRTITDRHMQVPNPWVDDYHDRSPVMLPPGTHMKPGETVLIDSYSGFPIPGNHSIALCMTDPDSLKWIARNGKAIHGILPFDSGMMLGYDEIRQMNSCGSCRALHLSAGELLARSVQTTVKAYESFAPKMPLYIWNDMFDPFHNGHVDYFHVEGDLAGAEKSIPADVTIMNWNMEKLHDSLQWFSGRDSKQPVAHKQIIAGYYDTGNGGAAATSELQAAAGIPGVMGMMYTTWNDDYGQMESFASAARAGWKNYVASVK